MNHTTVSDLKDNYDELTEAANNAKEATGGLDDWDHVSTLGSSSSSSSSDNFDYSKLMNLENDYAKKLEELAKEQEGFYKQKLQEAWDEFKNNTITDFEEWYKEVTGKIVTYKSDEELAEEKQASAQKVNKFASKWGI